MAEAQSGDRLTDPGLAEYTALVAGRDDPSLGLNDLAQTLAGWQSGRLHPGVYMFPFTLFGGVALLAVAAVHLGYAVLPAIAACILGVLAAFIIEWSRDYGPVKTRLGTWDFTLKLFTGEFTDDTFGAWSRGIVDRFLSRKGATGLVRATVLLGLEMDRFVEVPSRIRSYLVIACFVLLQMGGVVYAGSSSMIAEEHIDFLLGIVVVTVIIELLVCETERVMHRVFFMLEYVQAEINHLRSELTGDTVTVTRIEL